MRSRVDFAASFSELDGVDHFHAHSLQGRIRVCQMRPEDATPHFELATAAYRIIPDPTPQDQLRLFYLRLYELECAFFLESLGVRTPQDTEILYLQLLETRAPDRVIVDQQRIYHGALLHIQRGRFEEAEEAFTLLLTEEPDEFETRRILFHWGLAVCAWELGDRDTAKRAYENAALSMGFIDSPLKRAFYATALYPLAKHWAAREGGMEGEAEQWKQTLYAQPGTKESKDAVFARAEYLVQQSQRNGTFRVA